MIIKIILAVIVLSLIGLIIYLLSSYLKSFSYEADYEMGVELFNQKKYPEAEKAFDKVLQQKEDHYQSLYNLGLTCLFLKKLEKAKINFQKALLLDQTDSDLFYNLALIFHQETKLDKAIEYYRRALSISNNDKDAMYNLGLAYKQKKKYDKALDFITKAIAIDPSDANYRIGLGVMYHEMRNEEGKNEYLDFAIEAFNEVIKMDENNETAIKELCFCHSRRGHVKETVDYCRQYLELKNDNTEIRNLLALSYYCQKDFKGAIEEFLKLKEIQKDSPDVDLSLAFAYDKSGDKEKSKVFYTQFISQKPNYYAKQQLQNYFEKEEAAQES